MDRHALYITPDNLDANHASQRFHILSLLRGGNWVPAHELAAHALQYNERLHELRQQGFHIVNKVEKVEGVTRSWYRLEKESAPKLKPSTEAKQGHLFEEAW
jgi:hypothetical protein